MPSSKKQPPIYLVWVKIFVFIAPVFMVLLLALILTNKNRLSERETTIPTDRLEAPLATENEGGVRRLTYKALGIPLECDIEAVSTINSRESMLQLKGQHPDCRQLIIVKYR